MTDQSARLSCEKTPQRAADQNEFDCVVAEGSLRWREKEAAESATSLEGFHRPPECSSLRIYIIDKS